MPSLFFQDFRRPMTTVDQNYTISVNSNGVLSVVVVGNVDRKQVIAVIEKQWELGVAKSFWDLTEANVGSLSSNDVIAIAEHVRRCRPQNFKPGATAFLVSTAFNFGMMRMVQAYSNELGFEIRVEQDRERLEHWLQDLPQDSGNNSRYSEEKTRG